MYHDILQNVCRTDKTKSEAFALHLSKFFQPYNIYNWPDTEHINNFYIVSPNKFVSHFLQNI